MSIRRTQTKVSDPTDLEIGQAILDTGLTKNFNVHWIRDLYQCFSVDSPFQALSKPATWSVNEVERTRLKKEQLLLTEIVRHNTVEGDALKRAIVNSFKLHEVADQLKKPTSDFIKQTSIPRILEYMEEGVEMVRTLQKNPFLADVLGIPEDLFPEVTLSKLTNEQRKILSILSQVNQIDNLKVGSFASMVEDHESKTKKEIPISNYSELLKIHAVEMVHPAYPYRAATKAYTLQKGVKTLESKQTLILVIDGSASMDEDWKQAWVKAILVNRGLSVADGRSELYVAQYRETICTPFTKITTKEEFKDYYVNYKKQLEGASTEVGSVIADIEQQLINNRVGEHAVNTTKRPHVLVINDGQDSVNPLFRANATVHAFVLGMKNSNLKRLVHRSGGHYQIVML